MSRKFTTLIAIAAGAAASNAHAQIFDFDFPITVDQATPGSDVTGFDPSGSGSVSLDLSTNTIEWEISYQGLTGDIVAPGAHFHGPAGFGMTGPVQLDIAGDAGGTGAGVPLPQPPTGVMTGTAVISAQQAQDVLNGLWYVNIHTARNGPGEIRGQVVPSPSGLSLLALGGLAAIRRRR